MGWLIPSSHSSHDDTHLEEHPKLFTHHLTTGKKPTCLIIGSMLDEHPKQLTHHLQVAHLIDHRLHVNLAHVVACVLRFHGPDVQSPCSLVCSSDAEARNERHGTVVNGQKNLAVDVCPGNLWNSRKDIYIKKILYNQLWWQGPWYWCFRSLSCPALQDEPRWWLRERP